MGHTKGDRQGDIRAYFNNYKIPVKLKAGELDQCADLGKYDVFFTIFPEHSHLFLVEGQTFADGAAYPANYFGYAGRAWISDGSGGELPCVFIHPTERPFIERNSRLAPSATQPVIFVSDQEFHVLPDNLVPTICCFQFPAPLADAATALSATDTMPEFSEPMIARAGFEYGLKMMLDQQTALELNRAEVEHYEKVLKEGYERKFAELNKMPTEVQ